MKWIEILGYCAALLTFITYYMRTMIPLRLSAIGSDVLFIVYGSFTHAFPVLIVHALLLPLNAYRLLQMLKLVKRIRKTTHAGLSIDHLLPFMSRKQLKQGDLLFGKGDPANSMYYMLQGIIEVRETQMEIGPGNLAGVIGVFMPGKGRPWTAICKTDVELLAISEDKVVQVCYEHPQFGIYLAELVTQRLVSGHPSH